MTATNHVLTGIIIASTIHIPALALPLAFLSHFALDSLPHYGTDIRSSKFKAVLATDAYIASIILLLVLLLHPAHMWVIVAGGILAASPDLMWLPDFIAILRGKPKVKHGPIGRFHAFVQWYQKPKGAYIEVVWFVAAFLIVFTYAI